MISLYPIIMLNVFGALEVLFPILLLYFLYRYKTYKFSSIICGLALYFIIAYMISNNVFTIIRVIAGEMYFIDHPMIGVLIDTAITALAMSPLFYLIMSKVRRGKWNLYDAVAMGIGYWMVPQFLDGALAISTASILQQAKKGNLESLVNETYTIELLEALVKSMTESSHLVLTLERLSTCFVQLILLLVIIAVSVTVYYVVKRNRGKMVLLIMAVSFVVILIMNGSSVLFSDWKSLIPIVIVGIATIYYLIRFYRFYRSQQMELLRKRKEFKEERHRKYLEEHPDKE